MAHDEDAQAEGEAPGLLSPGARGFIWYSQVNVPGLSFPIRVPVIHADHPPTGHEAEVFTWKPASEFDEHWVALDLPTARRIGTRLLNAMAELPILDWTP